MCIRDSHKDDSYYLPVVGKFNVNSLVEYLGLDMSDVSEKATYISPLESLVLVDDYKNLMLTAQKYNNVSFRSPINDLITVNISGAVDFPGNYTLNANSSLAELYNLVGDFKEEAYLDGIIFLRESIREKQLAAIEKSKDCLLYTSDAADE